MVEWIEYLLQYVPFINNKNKRDLRRPKPDKFEKKKLKVFIGTWNMHGKLPPYNLSPFVEQPSMKHETNGLYLKKNEHHPYHILVIGTQECLHNIKHSVLFPSKEEWEQRLKKYLGDDYILIKTETMAALHLVSWKKKTLK
jgi:hypothetical protein